MVDYNVVRFCRLCKKRMVFRKGEIKKRYCDECQKLIDEEEENERKG